MFHNVIVPGWWQSVAPVTYGAETCRPGHSFGPAVRSYYLLHYVLSGKGIFIRSDGTYEVGEGDIFVIRPGEVTTYRASEEDPWDYVWLSFTCEEEPSFLNTPVLRRMPVRHLFADIRSCGEERGLDGRIFALTYELLWLLSRNTEKSSGNAGRYAEYVKAYIENSYMLRISFQELAGSLHIDRRYLTAIFRSHYGQSPQTYLMELRLEKAREFLEQGHSVSDAAAMAGFSDLSNFSRRFKARFGVPPSGL